MVDVPVVPIQFLGNKRKYLPDIYQCLDGCESLIDLFSGSSNVSYYMKRRGLRVTSVDLLRFCYYIAHAVVENQRITASAHLTPTGKPSSTLMTDLFGNKVFLEEDTLFLDALREHIPSVPWKYVRSLMWASASAAIIAKSSFGRFNVGLGNHLTEKKLSKHKARPLEDYYREKVAEFSNLVVDGPECEALCLDVTSPSIRELRADAVYIDPPYPTFRRQTSYEYFYHFLETFVAGTPEWTFSDRGNIQKEVQSKFSSLQGANLALAAMFENVAHIRRWIVHYASHCRPGIEELVKMIEANGRNIVQLKEFEAGFSKSVYSTNRQPTEFLIVAE